MTALGKAPDTSSLHEKFQNALGKRYFIRLHMTVMMGLVVLAGILASRLLHRAGVDNMGVRYPIAVAVSYLAFFSLIRLWIAYVTRAARARQARSGGSGSGSLDVSGDFGFSSGGGRAAGAGGRLLEGGGSSGGAGSSMSFADGESMAARQAVVPLPAPSQSGGGHSGGGGFDLDGDGAMLLLLFVLLIGAICGAGIYLVWQAPAILSEAAFQVVLAPCLVRTARSAHEPGWMESVFRKTVLPFALVLVLAAVFGNYAHRKCPGATTLRQVFAQCIH